MTAPRPRRRAGFSLIELMVATTLGALLLVAVTSLAGSMTRTIAQLQSESTDSYDKAMARLARDVRYAWWVDVPTRTQLRIADSSNRVTEYYRVGNSLLVRLPSGDEGSVVTGLDGVNFKAFTTRRLRDGAKRPASGQLDGASEPASTSAGLKLMPGNQLALGFRVNSDGGIGDVSDVRENVTEFLPDRLDLKVARGTSLGILRVTIYRARAPGDARPKTGASAITSFDMSFATFPAGTILIAPTNPLDISTAIFASPSAQLPLAIPAFAPNLEPGVAYTAVLSVTAGSMAIVGGNVAASPNPQVQFRTSSSAAWTVMSGVVPFGLFGDKKLTATVATDVVRSVEIKLDPTDGSQRSSNVVVHSQVMADEPWLGVLPGETAP